MSGVALRSFNYCFILVTIILLLLSECFLKTGKKWFRKMRQLVMKKIHYFRNGYLHSRWRTSTKIQQTRFLALADHGRYSRYKGSTHHAFVMRSYNYKYQLSSLYVQLHYSHIVLHIQNIDLRHSLFEGLSKFINMYLRSMRTHLSKEHENLHGNANVRESI